MNAVSRADVGGVHRLLDMTFGMSFKMPALSQRARQGRRNPAETVSGEKSSCTSKTAKDGTTGDLVMLYQIERKAPPLRTGDISKNEKRLGLYSVVPCDGCLWHFEGYKSNHNVVYSSKYHCVWTPKYRRAVLGGPIAKRCEQILYTSGNQISG